MEIQGMVVHGKKEARTLGYPTANIAYTSLATPEAGVWTCFIDIEGKAYQGLAVVGMWYLSTGEPSVEVHVFDFQEEIYGKIVVVIFGIVLRPLKKFETLEILKTQIKQDIERGRDWFKRRADDKEG